MKTAEELNELRIEYEALSEKLSALDEEELEQVCGGLALGRRFRYWPRHSGEAETVNRNPGELNEEELEQVTGGLSRVKRESSRDHIIVERRKREEFNTPGLKRKRRAEESPEV